MSTPQNPLSAFRSYSYYHVLVICNTSETAETLSSVTEPKMWLHPLDASDTGGSPEFNILGRYAPKRISNPSGSTGKYVVLINGSSDAAFVINNVKWVSATAAAAVPTDGATSIALEGSMEITEPKGIAFLDTIVTSCIGLGIDAANAVFMLKTFFVGYNDGKSLTLGEGTVTHISDIQPLMCIVYDTVGSFDQNGGSYVLNFVGLAHGAARLPQYSKAVTTSITAGNTLGSTVAKLETQINQNYQIYYDCVRAQVTEAASEIGGKALLVPDLLRRVNYKIEVDAVYLEDNYHVGDVQSASTNMGLCGEPAIIKFSPNSTVEDSLHRIMRSSNLVNVESSTGVKNDSGQLVKYEYKIHTALSSKDTGTGTEYTVTYVIKRFLQPKSVSNFDVLASNDEPTAEIAKSIKRNLIEFDYIYTGKNTDILEFDMKLNMGQAYMQIATMTNTLKDQLETVAGSSIHVSDLAMLNRFQESVPIPVYFGSQIKSPLFRHTNSNLQAAASAYTIAKHSSLEVQDAQVKIIGNVNLLSTVNGASAPASVRATAKPSTVGANFNDWSTFPSYAKVNIKMPRNNDDIALFKGVTNDSTSQSFTKDFWFRDYYYVVSVEHEFSQGQFTQTLQMIGIPKKGINDVTAAANRKDADLSKVIDNCYSDVTGIGCKDQNPAPPTSTQAPNVPVVPFTPPVQTNSADALITGRNDAKTINGQERTPDSVKGYKQASPKVKAAILAAGNSRVSATKLAQIISHETGFTFNPDAISPTGATGLGQFTKRTWLTLARSHPELGMSNLSDKEALEKRTDESTNALATRILYTRNQDELITHVKRVYKAEGVKPPTNIELSHGDVYLAHVVGAAIAGSAVGLDMLGHGGNPASDAWDFGLRRLYKTSAERIAKYQFDVKNNPSVFKNRLTIRSLREGAEAVQANTFTKPVQTTKVPTPKTPAATTNTPPAAVTTVAAPVSPPASQRIGAITDCNPKRTEPNSTCNQSPANKNTVHSH